MNLNEWLEDTPIEEIEESLIETDGTMTELIGEYKQSANDRSKGRHIFACFELMLEEAKEYHEEQADNDICPRCNDNGMYCDRCGGSGKRRDEGERVAYEYDKYKDEQLMKGVDK